MWKKVISIILAVAFISLYSLTGGFGFCCKLFGFLLSDVKFLGTKKRSIRRLEFSNVLVKSF
jgi:hypothetical protein